MPVTLSASLAPAQSAVVAFFRWWGDGLRDMLPGRTTDRDIMQPGLRIFPTSDQVEIEHVARQAGTRWVHDGPLETLDEASWQQIAAFTETGPVQLVLPTDWVYRHAFPLPAAGRAHLETAVRYRLQADLPFPLADYDWGWRAAQRANGFDILTAFAHRDAVENIAALFADHGLMPPSIGIFEDERWLALSEPVALGPDTRQKAWRHAALAVLGAPLVATLLTIAGAEAIAYANDQSAAKLQDKVRAHGAKLAAARAEDRYRARLAPIAQRPPVSQVIAPIASELPEGHWLADIGNPEKDVLTMRIRTADPEVLQAAIEVLRGPVEWQPAGTEEDDQGVIASFSGNSP